MLEVDTCYTLTNVPYLTYDALDEFAEKLIFDFAPERLNNPGAVDVERFIEFYLRLAVDFRRLCYNRKILGITAFNDGVVEVIDDDSGEPMELFVESGTVIIDPSLSVKSNLPRLRFTLTHEGCHWLIHRKAFDESNPFGPAGIYENQYIAAKEGRVDYSRSTKEKNDIDWMERQADFLASAILMPRPALREAFKDYFKFYNERPRRIIRGSSPLDDCYAIQLPEYVANIFNVSKRAALIRLEKLTAIVNQGWPYYR
jgi:Zn-dependent peptidase ImmA (M78 family)